MEKSILLTTLGMGLLMMALKAGAQDLPVDKVGDGPQLYAFQCAGEENQTLKVIHVKDRAGALQATIHYAAFSGQPAKTFYSFTKPEGSTSFKTYSYELNDGIEKVGDLQIVEHTSLTRGGCGRGGCNNVWIQKYATLKIGPNEIILDCN